MGIASMAGKPVGAWALGLNLVLLFGVAAWMRVSSLEAMPEVISDEVHGNTQLVRFLTEGKMFSVWAFNGSPVNPFLPLLSAAVHLVLPPSLWMVRASSVVSGILAIVLTYVLGARVLDRTTALIAAAFLAVLPIAIIFSRIGYDATQTPLFTMLAFYAAFRAHRGGLLLAFLACFIVQPTNVFLLPALGLVFLASALQGTAGDWPAQRRLLLQLLGVSVLVIVVVGITTFRRSYVHALYSNHLGPRDPVRFLTLYPRLMLGQVLIRDLHAPGRWQEWLFWGVFLALTALGTPRLVRSRQWDRVALVPGLALSALGLFVVGGSEAIRPGAPRYGMFLVVPTALMLACQARSLLVEPAGPRLIWTRRLQHALLLALGWSLLFAARWNWFDSFAIASGESIWTFHLDRKDPNSEVLSLILRDLRQTHQGQGQGPVVVMSETYWTDAPIEYLGLARGGVRVVPFYEKGMDYDQLRHHAFEQMDQGAYAIGFSGGPLERFMNVCYLPGQVQRWDVPHNYCDFEFWTGSRTLVVYRLTRPAPSPSTAAAPPQASPARR